MSVNLYGNINGKTYTAPSIDLFEMANSQKKEKVAISDSSIGKDLPAVTVNISEEGIKALHGSKLKGSADPFETAARIAYMSEHQPIESFTSRFSQMIPSNYVMSESGEAVFVHHSMEEKEQALTDGFKTLVDEVNKGYDEGTRVRYVEDSSSEDGFRKLNREEELDILKKEFDEFVDSRFGSERKAKDEVILESLRGLQELKKRLGRGESKNYETEKVPDDFAEKLKNKMKRYMGEKYGYQRN